jgi:magnesium transporter
MGEYFRDVFDHLQRLHGTIEGIRDMHKTAIQGNAGMINLNETKVTKKLAGWAAIIAVPTLIAGIYGMNFKNMPEYELEYGYPLAIAAMIAIDIALYVWFRRIRWL